MVEIALVFVGLALLVLLALLVSAVYLVPRVLAEEAPGDESHQSGGQTN